jgi:hypothetical protein
MWSLLNHAKSFLTADGTSVEVHNLALGLSRIPVVLLHEFNAYLVALEAPLGVRWVLLHVLTEVADIKRVAAASAAISPGRLKG